MAITEENKDRYIGGDVEIQESMGDTRVRRGRIREITIGPKFGNKKYLSVEFEWVARMAEPGEEVAKTWLVDDKLPQSCGVGLDSITLHENNEGRQEAHIFGGDLLLFFPKGFKSNLTAERVEGLEELNHDS